MSTMFYSNCLIEAIKAKLKHPFKVKIKYVPAYLNEVFCPHVMWHDGEYTYDFYAKGYLTPFQRLWHKGIIRKSEYEYYDRVISILKKRKKRSKQSKFLNGDAMELLYEVVCTKNYLDIGLCVEKDKTKPVKVLARAHTFGMSEYGGVESLSWINTGVYLTKDDWKNISYNKSTDQIMERLKILKIIKTEEATKGDNNMTTIRDVVDNRAYGKKYNVEWYLDNGQVQTTSAVMTSIENGYMYFKYPSGGIFIVKDYAIRSLQCLE